MTPPGVQVEAARLLGQAPAARAHGSARFGGAWDVESLAVGAVAAFVDSVAALTGTAAEVDAAAVTAWFRQAVTPVGWSVPSPWDAVAGDYRARDGWIRLHTNAPRHRAAALGVLDAPAEREAVAVAVAGWSADALETAVVRAGGAAAAVRPPAAPAGPPPGAAVRRAALVARAPRPAASRG
ncbi:hypothetical protein ACFSBI_08375, partial [Amnibacterium endophyticum]